MLSKAALRSDRLLTLRQGTSFSASIIIVLHQTNYSAPQDMLKAVGCYGLLNGMFQTVCGLVAILQPNQRVLHLTHVRIKEARA